MKVFLCLINLKAEMERILSASLNESGNIGLTV